VRYRDLLVATLSRAMCEMQACSTTLFGFVIDIERRQCAQKSGRRWRQWRPPSALPSRAASIDSGGFGPRRPSSRHFLTTASVRESTVPDRPPSGLGFLSLAPDSRCGSLDPPIAASCNADSTNRSNIKLEAHRLKCVASHCDVSGPAIKRAISAKIDRDAASFASGELIARFMASRPPFDAAPPRRPCTQRRGQRSAMCVNFAGVCARISASVWCRSALAIRRATVLAGLGHDCSTFFGVIPNCLSLFACRYPQITYDLLQISDSLL
jgi:hypothetical protein